MSELLQAMLGLAAVFLSIGIGAALNKWADKPPEIAYRNAREDPLFMWKSSSKKTTTSSKEPENL